MKLASFLIFLSLRLTAAEPLVLFDGKTLDGWKAVGAAECWTVREGMIVGKNNEKKQASVLWSNEIFKDFELEAEFRFSGSIDSGIFLRNENEQIQLGESRSLKRDMSCSPYIGNKKSYPVEAVGVGKLLRADEWNQIKIAVKGKKYIVSLNGKQVLDYTTDEAPEKGPIGLQIHMGVEMQIFFRHVRVSPL